MRRSFVPTRTRFVAGIAALMGAGLTPQDAVALDPDCISPPHGGLQGSEMCNLGTLDGYSSRIARRVNADGTVVVGTGRTTSGTPSAFRWVEGGAGGGPGNPQMQDLGDLFVDGCSWAAGVNADGAVVVGGSGDGVERAFRWVQGGTGGVSHDPKMEDLGTLDGMDSGVAEDVNAQYKRVLF